MAAMRGDQNDQQMLILTGALAGYNTGPKHRLGSVRNSTTFVLKRTELSAAPTLAMDPHTSQQQTVEHHTTCRQYPASLQGRLHPVLVCISTDHAVTP